MKLFRRALLALVALPLLAPLARAADIHLMTSGAFEEAYRKLIPIFEAQSGHRLVSAYGSSMGSSPTSIPSRLARGEPADVVVLADSALANLIQLGRVVPESRVPLVNSLIGLAVRAGAPRPDISTVDALRRTLLAAQSIAYSDRKSVV